MEPLITAEEEMESIRARTEERKRSRDSYAGGLFFFLLILAFASCSPFRMATAFRTNNLRMYQGPVLPKGEVGYLIRPTNAEALRIVEVDDVTVTEIKKAAGFENEYKAIELLPGKHTVKVIGERQQGRATISMIARWSFEISGEWILEFDAEAGHVYILDLKIGKKKEVVKDGRGYASEGSYYTIRSVFIADAQTDMIVSRETNK